ncbi:extended synaptotagmin-3 [Oryzias melastigma]|uniref:Extended synaptotagmin-3 n=1 Tax=Oryzias melastigma TaxID=30732 RepID=A0A3B3BUL5_ORYME|nr:extended synaptotagmin-3 [Oryzias melastigma]
MASMDPPPAAAPGGEGTLSPAAVNRMLMELLIYVGRTLVVLYPVYLTGYLGFSISWVLLCTLMVTWWKKNRVHKDSRIGSAIDFLDNEKQVISTELGGSLQMASWVNFTDVEKVQWVNKVLEQAWPFFGMYMEKLLKGNIQQTIRLSNSALKTFTFTKVHFGHKAPKITGIRAYTQEVDQREVILDLSLNFDSDMDIDAAVNSAITAGVKGVKIQGMLRVILEPLISEAPLVGGVTFFFIRRPTLDLNWTGMTNLLDSPGFSSLSDGTIMDIIASLMVLPNRMCIPLIDQVKVDQMRFPLPRGVVRVHVLEARDLVPKDTYMKGLVKGKSDPYAVVRVGNRHFKTKTINNCLDPKWNEVYEFVVHEAPGQELEVELFDKDNDNDDPLGNFRIDLGEVKKEKVMKQWFPLKSIQHGEICLQLNWLSLQSESHLLQESHNGLACAMLAVYLDSASNLSRHPPSESTSNHKQSKQPKEERLTKQNSRPNSYVEFSVGKDVLKSKVVYGNKDPTWEEGFTFFVHNVKTQVLYVKVKDHDKKVELGTLALPLSRLLHISDMVLDQRFLLERSGANSEIKLKATLRILTMEEKPKPTAATPQSKPPIPQAKVGGVSPNIPAAASSSSGPVDRGTKTDPSSPQLSHPSASDSWRSSTTNMRRYDSRSLLSENSLASSRFDLLDGASYPEAIRNHQGSFGDIKLTIRYAGLRKKLLVVVEACRDLFPCSENGTDSYVRLYLLPDQAFTHRKKTHVQKKTVSPVFNEKFEYDVTITEASKRKLDVAVKNNKMFHRKERKDIGTVIIDLSLVDLENGISEWFELTLPGLKK